MEKNTGQYKEATDPRRGNDQEGKLPDTNANMVSDHSSPDGDAHENSPKNKEVIVPKTNASEKEKAS